MTQARLILACIAPALLAACSPYLPRYAPVQEEVETGFYEDIDTPRLALLEYRLGKYFAQDDRPYEVVCASDERPSVVNGKTERAPLDPDVELALIKRFPGLSPLTRCKVQGIDVVAADTGVAAAIFDVNEFSCEARDNCVGWGGYYANGKHGWNYYRLRFERGQWRIRLEDLGIVLTGGESVPESAGNTDGPASLPTLPDEPGVAMLDKLLSDHFGSDNRYSTTCATIAPRGAKESALEPEVEQALIAHHPGLSPLAQCVWKNDAVLVDRDTGERAIMFQVRGLSCRKSEDCTAMAGWVTANLGASYLEYRIRKVAGAWVFEPTGSGVVS